MGVVSNDASNVLVTYWQNAHHLQANRTEKFQCIHSNPLLGTLAPGESKTVSGCVLFISGDLEEAWKQARIAIADAN